MLHRADVGAQRDVENIEHKKIAYRMTLGKKGTHSPRLATSPLIRQAIRTISNAFALSPTLSHFHAPLRTFGNQFALSPTFSHFRQPFRTFADHFAPSATNSHF